MNFQNVKYVYVVGVDMSDTKSLAVSCDLDDTLIPTHFLFEDAKEQFVELMQEHTTADKQTIRETLEQTDKEMYSEMGITKDRFAISLRETVGKMLDSPSESLQQQAFEIGMTPIKTPEEYASIGVLNGYEAFCEAVSEVAEHAELVTVGVSEVQKNKINAVGANESFDKISIKDSGEKDAPLRRMKDNYDVVVHIGNSLQSDIKPADELGIHSIHVTNADWLGEYSPDNPDKIQKAESLVEAKEILQTDFEE